MTRSVGVIPRELNPLPRELKPGLHWLGGCLPQGDIHTYCSVFVVAGERYSAIIDGGIPTTNDYVLEQIGDLVDNGLPELKYILPTHSEWAHSAVLGHVLHRFPQVTAHGDVSDLHLVYPQFADRLHFADPGDRFDLGGTEIVVTESIWRDLVTSRWYFDTKSRTLFGGDGFAYAHEHTTGACGHMAEEVTGLDVEAGMKAFAEAAFNWTAFVDPEPYVQRLNEEIFDVLHAELLAPGHGLPIGNPNATMPAVNDGLRTIAKLG